MNAAWKTAVGELAQKVESWIAPSLGTKSHWVLHELTMDPTPDEPLLEIEVDEHSRLLLEPAAFASEKLPTKVHLYAYPTLRRAVLVGPDERGNWDIQSSEGVSMNYAWNGQDFLKLLSVLAEKHVPGSV